MKELKLDKNIASILKKNDNTPRTAICLYLRINNPEKKAGVYSLLNRLFLQGTFNRTAEKLAQELDENGIELYSEMKYDFIRFKVLALNEDIELAYEILADIVKNSSLEMFEKEVFKLKGEIEAELDNPKTKLLEDYFKNLYEGHYYGNTYLRIIEDIDKITIEDIKEAYSNLLNNSQKCFVVCGDFDEENMLALQNKYFSDLKFVENFENDFWILPLPNKKISKIVKDDANQAQIIQGWHVPTFNSEDYIPLMVFNTILGSMGLSSRLFRELREKKGLAYTVRSSYETNKYGAGFSVYIATEPSNIQISLNGFKEEIDKLKNELVSENELNDAKNNLLGKRQFFTETNIQQASLFGYYYSSGLGADYSSTIEKEIMNVTSEQIKNVANKYFNDNYVLSIIAPEKFLEEI